MTVGGVSVSTTAVVRFVLFGVFAILTVQAAWAVVQVHPVGVDVDIPLRATARWLDGGEPYLASAFRAEPGRDLPFLYPPYVLPLFAPFTLLPTGLVIAASIVGLALAGGVAARRLGFPWWLVPLVLAWPPFAEAIVGTNVEVLAFAAFVVLLVPPPLARLRTRSALAEGALAALTCVAKVSQPHVLLNRFGSRWRAGAAALALIAGLAIVTLPLVGVDAWFEWLAQARRAADPEWAPIGIPLSAYVPQPVALSVTLAALALALVVRGPRTAAWIGLLVVIGNPSLHMFGLLYLLPAMVVVRREIALVAAILVATYVNIAIWGAIGLVAWAMLASTRYPALAEPTVSAMPASSTA